VFADPAYRNAELHTGFIEEFFQRNGTPVETRDPEAELVAALVGAIHAQTHNEGAAWPEEKRGNRWVAAGREALLG
jgi:hypothetical protein